MPLKEDFDENDEEDQVLCPSQLRVELIDNPEDDPYGEAYGSDDRGNFWCDSHDIEPREGTVVGFRHTEVPFSSFVTFEPRSKE